MKKRYHSNIYIMQCNYVCGKRILVDQRFNLQNISIKMLPTIYSQETYIMLFGIQIMVYGGENFFY